MREKQNEKGKKTATIHGFRTARERNGVEGDGKGLLWSGYDMGTRMGGIIVGFVRSGIIEQKQRKSEAAAREREGGRRTTGTGGETSQHCCYVEHMVQDCLYISRDNESEDWNRDK